VSATWHLAFRLQSKGSAVRIPNLIKLFRVGSLFLLLGVGVVAQQVSTEAVAPSLPNRLGDFVAQDAVRPLPLGLDAAALEDFAVVSAGRRNYTSAEGARFAISVVRTNTDSAAYSMLRHLVRKPTPAPTAVLPDLGLVGTAQTNRLIFIKGSTLIEIVGMDGQAASASAMAGVARLVADSVEGVAGETPVLVQHLPNAGRSDEQISYAVSLPALQTAAGQRPALEAVSFDGGAEAVTTQYGNDARLVIIEFMTPQYAAETDARIGQRIAQLRAEGQPVPSAYKRIGNYSVFVFDAPHEQAAQQLIGGIKYEKEVQWLGDNPRILERAQRDYTVTMGNVLLSTLKLTGISLLCSLGIGGLIGGAVFIKRRRAQAVNGGVFSDAGGMMRLNLEDLPVRNDSSKLLGSGE